METRTIIVIFAAAVIKALILSWWGRFKERKALEPTPLALRKGVYVPWGAVEKIQHYGWRFTQVWMVYIAVLVVALIYVKLIAPYL